MIEVLVISEPGTTVHAEKDHLVLERGGHAVREVPLSGLSEVLCVGRVEWTSTALWKCLRHDVRVVFMTRDGRYLGRVSGALTRNGDLRLAQYRAVTDPKRAVEIAKRVVEAKMHNQRSLLMRRQRDLKDPDIALALSKIRRIMEQLDSAKDIEDVRGLEGAGAQIYFGVFGRLISNPLFSFCGRNRRPPRDPVNAMLSFGYTVVGALLEGDVEASGLDPALGCLHACAYGRASLMLDILEEFRTPVVDMVVLRLLNRRQIMPTDFGPPEGQSEDEEEEGDDNDDGFDPKNVIPALAENTEAMEDSRDAERDLKGAVYLRGPGKKIFLSALLQRLHERVFDANEQASFEIRAIMRNQVYRMARAFVDKDCQYNGFKMKE